MNSEKRVREAGATPFLRNCRNDRIKVDGGLKVGWLPNPCTSRLVSGKLRSVQSRALEQLKDRGELVVGLADAAACVLVYRRAGATAVVAIEFPEGQ
jgi:hypothetical protein